jgi:hypothetical protein
MATYYVHIGGGNDGAAGTINAPWNRPPQLGGTGPTTTILSGDTLYIKGVYTGVSSGGGNLWTINSTRYQDGCTILPWPGEASFTIDGNNAWTTVINISGVRVNMTGAIATGSKANDASSSGFRFAGAGAAGSVLTDCVAYGNRRFGFYGNNVGASAAIRFVRCRAYANTTSSSDNGGAGRYAAGFNLDGTGACVLDRCVAERNGNAALVGADLDGRGYSIVGGSNNCTLVDCESSGNGDPLGLFGAPNGSGLEGFASTGVVVTRLKATGEATGAEIKSGCNNWTITNSLFEGSSSGPFQWGYFSGTGSTGLTLSNVTVICTGVQPFTVGVELSSANATIKNVLVLKTQRFDWVPWAIANGSVDIDPATVTFDNCAAFGDTTGNLIKWQTTSSNVAYTPSQWAALYPSHFPGYVATDPMLTDTHRPRAGSPLIGAGTHLGYTRDIERKQRPNPPSIGAYDHTTMRTE